MLRFWFAIWIAKISKFLSRSFRIGGGTAAPGLLAAKWDPQILSKFAKRIPDGSILVTGTNGKTTTARLLHDVLDVSGKDVIYNRSGSNLARGIISTLIDNSTIFGKVKGTVGLFEVDEAATPEIAAALNPKIFMVTNLFRDQLDRYGELDRTAKLIGSAIAKLDRSNVILNADDPLVASLKSYVPAGSNTSYFGVEDSSLAVGEEEHAIDTRECLYCGQPLNFKTRYYGHLGVYECPTGDLTRPAPDVAAGAVQLKGLAGSSMIIAEGLEQNELETKIPGLYNIYNIVAAAAAARSLSISFEKVREAVHAFQAAFGRMERIEFHDKFVYLLLIKNPVGFNQVLKTFASDPDAKKLLIAINDNFADGTDVSWLWDVDFEQLAGKYSDLVTSGLRAEDMTLRLKYAGLPLDNVKTIPDLDAAFDEAAAKTEPKDTLYVMPTYTAMLELRKIIKKKAPGLKEFWND